MFETSLSIIRSYNLWEHQLNLRGACSLSSDERKEQVNQEKEKHRKKSLTCIVECLRKNGSLDNSVPESCGARIEPEHWTFSAKMPDGSIYDVYNCPKCLGRGIWCRTCGALAKASLAHLNVTSECGAHHSQAGHCVSAVGAITMEATIPTEEDETPSPEDTEFGFPDCFHGAEPGLAVWEDVRTEFPMQMCDDGEQNLHGNCHFQQWTQSCICSPSDACVEPEVAAGEHEFDYSSDASSVRRFLDELGTETPPQRRMSEPSAPPSQPYLSRRSLRKAGIPPWV